MRYKVTLSGKTYEVEVEKGEAILIDVAEAAAPAPLAAVPAPPVPVPTAGTAPAPAAAPAGGGEAVSAPMPGTILSVKVTSGQAVKKGEVLFILEAMKMENEIMAPRDAKVGQVFVSQGAAVDTGAPLLTLV